MTARLVKPKDALHAVAISRSGGKCEIAKQLRFGAVDHRGDPNANIVQLCSKPIEGVFYTEDDRAVAMCKECRLNVFGKTGAEKRKATIARKDAQLALVVREKEKP